MFFSIGIFRNLFIYYTRKYIYFLSKVLCSLYLGMVDRQIYLSSYVVSRAQSFGHKHSLGIVSPPGPVPPER